MACRRWEIYVLLIIYHKMTAVHFQYYFISFSPDSIGFNAPSSRSYKFSLHSLTPHLLLIREFRVITFSRKSTDKFNAMSSLLFLPVLKFKSNLLVKLMNNNKNGTSSRIFVFGWINYSPCSCIRWFTYNNKYLTWFNISYISQILS